MKKKEQAEAFDRVLARVLAKEISNDVALKSITGGCSGNTCTAGLVEADTDRNPSYEV